MVVAVLIVASVGAALIFLNEGAGGKDNVTGQTVTVIDDRGKNVTLPANPQRIVSLGSSFTEIINDLGRIDTVVAADYSSMWLAPNSTDGFADLGQVSSLSVESILAQDPDCVVIWNFNMYQAFIGHMEDAHIPVLAFYPKSVDDVLSTIVRLGTAIGEKDNATLMADDMQERINAITSLTSTLSASEKPKVYLELETGNGATVRNGSISDQLITMAGGINVFHDLPTSESLTVGNEAIIGKNPDIIVIENGSAKTNDQLKAALGSSVNAVANDKIYRINDGTLTTSPSMINALENLAKWFHPELFD